MDPPTCQDTSKPLSLVADNNPQNQQTDSKALILASPKPLAPYIAQTCSHDPAQPSPFPKSPIFGSCRPTPCLDKSRTNRILVYPGSFNPPHRGHLHLLKHAFLRGGPDLNLIAAIVRPTSDKSLVTKVTEAGSTFMFGRDERCLLWKQDLGFPEWAFVYEDGTKSLDSFLSRLKETIITDGYKLEYVMLYGPETASPDCPPSRTYGCEMVMLCDAARRATYQRFSGRIRDFEGCTKWKQVRLDKQWLEYVEYFARAKAQRTLESMDTICQREALSMQEDGPAYVEKATQESVAKLNEDLESVLYCRRPYRGQKLTLRFVKCNENSSQLDRSISSTILRKIMSKYGGERLKACLEDMALSPQILWRSRTSWINKARLKANACITLPRVFFQPVEMDRIWDSDTDSEEEDRPPKRRNERFSATFAIIISNLDSRFEKHCLPRAPITRRWSASQVPHPHFDSSAESDTMPSDLRKRRSSTSFEVLRPPQAILEHVQA